MKFNPEDSFQLADGEGQFQILEAVDQVSKAGNPMIKLSLKVWDKNGKSGVLFDYLVSNLAFKIKHFCESIGQADWFEKGDLQCHALVGKQGKLVILNKDDPKYGIQPKIKDYIGTTATKVREKAPIIAPMPEDADVPF